MPKEFNSASGSKLKFLFCHGKKAIVLLVLVCVAAIAAIGATLAYIITQTDTAVNVFPPANIESAVDNSKITNTGDAEAYVRATVVVTWVSKDNASVIHAKSPVPGTDFSISYSTSGWKLGSDGFYYYTSPLDAGETTNPLITSCSELRNPPNGYKLDVKVIASAIQSVPASTVTDAWGVSVGADGTLAVN